MYKKQLLQKLLFCPLFLLISLSSFAQISVTGKVTDDKGAPLPGVSIAIKGTTKGTNSTASGTYSITVDNSSSVLVFTMVGFTRQQVTVGSQTNINVTLKDEEKQLNEVVVVGYGTQRRRDITGSVASVKGDQFKNQPITNPTEALQGRVAGVDIVKNSGAPDATPIIIIRGVASLSQPSPLYIVDGVRVPDGNNINVQDIASVDVLKDAAAAAIYGSAAAGGVILITTKRGNSAQPVINLSARYGITKPKLIHLLDKNDFIKLENYIHPAYFENADGSPKAGIDTLANTDWVNALYGNAYEQNYNLSIAGSSPVVNYLVSGFYNDQKGIYIKNYSNIGGARVNTDYKLGKYIKIGEQIAMSQRKTAPPVGSEAQLHNAPFRTLPIIPIMDKNGNYGIVPQGYDQVSQFGGPNPVGTAHFADAQNFKNNLQTNFFAEIALPFHLSFRTNLGYNYYLETQDTFQDKFSIGKVGIGTNSLTKSSLQSTQLLTNYVLTYDENFGKHHINAIAGFEQIINKFNNIIGTESSVGLPGYSFVQSSASNLSLAGHYDPNGLIKSEFGRLNYNYAGKYYLSGSIRQDANFTTFGPNKQKGTFPAASAGWNVSEESFWKNNVPVINNLKLRGSYGQLGNSNIGQYKFLATYSQFNATNGIASGAQNFAPGGPLVIANSINAIPNPALHWETVTETNIGLDGEALNGKIYFSAEYYNKNTSNMLYGINLPLSTGITTPFLANIGAVNNRGFDFMVGVKNQAGAFSYDVSATAGFNKNKVTKLDGIATSSIPDGYNYYSYGDAAFSATPSQNITLTKAGLPFGSFYGYKVLGIFKTDQEAAGQTVDGHVAHAGDLHYQDLDGNGKITDADRQIIGNPNPKLVYGINIHVGYKGFDAALLFNGVAGVQLYNGVKAYTQTPFSDGNTTSQVFGASFLGSNQVTSQPRIGIVDANGFTNDPNKNYSSVNSYFVESGNYLKLKNLQIGYSFPKAALSRAYIKGARIFVMANNVFTITKYSGLDPELGFAQSPSGYGVTTRGLDQVSQYPQVRIYSAGVDLTF
ncbi:SusC/RagA family TonB-linked outer membrane protein [Mucilaginibacter sp. FT3.2]|uniref:SusC/RagA family TonB-linked outer membrane protein n=1 Tax=Mucilaginibacter sp. FT3.2 TaxID=2723090 RepID=UPI00161D74EC|nr:TonB-dependent receptor [Mucilaginibacter sp. FT3.2]MBB6232853.1 TonB-linked SusC/RagA family outer membrane protein [Mucilaginibacter sp. FT3.2]